MVHYTDTGQKHLVSDSPDRAARFVVSGFQHQFVVVSQHGADLMGNLCISFDVSALAATVATSAGGISKAGLSKCKVIGDVWPASVHRPATRRSVVAE